MNKIKERAIQKQNLLINTARHAKLIQQFRQARYKETGRRPSYAAAGEATKHLL